MAQYEQRDMSGVLFKNDKKEKDSHPDYRGECSINGKKLQLSAWIKTSSKGNKFMSLAFSEPYVQKSDGVHEMRTPQASEQAGSFDNFEDDIPF